MNLNPQILLPATLLLLQACAPQQPPSATPPFDPQRLAAHTRFLAHDLLEGRGPGTRGEALSTEYLATQLALTGARPAGDNNSYFQTVPLVGIQTLPEAQLTWTRANTPKKLTFLQDFVAGSHTQTPQSSVNADLVFVGHGIVAPEFGWDDYKSTDVKGKVVLLFTNEPPSEDPAFFGGKALTYYGRWTFKYEQALRQGAAGALIIHTTPTAGYPWQVVRNSWSGQQPFVKLEPNQPALALAGWLSPEAAADILSETNQTLDELLAAANKKDFQPIPLKARVQATIPSQITELKTRNVVAILEGADPQRKDEAVLYTAHWDHLGIREVSEGDAIYNGAVDNATGCAILLEMARAFAQLPNPPARSILFAAVGAEEGGLRGSHYYGEHPAIPAGKTALDINYDGLLPLGKLLDFTVAGYERTTVKPLVEQLAAEMNLNIRPEAHPEQGYYYRSDHFSLARVGVPAFSVKPGVNYEGKPENWGAEVQETYTANHYHQPSDEFDESWDFRGLAQLAEFGFRLGRRVADQPDLPTWQPGDEFLASRVRSWAE